MRTDQYGHLAICVHAHGRRLVAGDSQSRRLKRSRIWRRAFDVASDAYANIAPPFALSLLQHSKLLIPKHLQRHLQRLAMAAALDLRSKNVGIRMFLLANHVAQADLRRVKS